jgi:hypothetical protein
MPYLVLRTLSRGPGKTIPVGSRTDLAWLSEAKRQKLVDVGAVRPVESPPLAELAGWQRRSERLAPLGIKTLEDFLAADVETIRRHLRVQSRTVKKWREQLIEWNNAPVPETGRRK